MRILLVGLVALEAVLWNGAAVAQDCAYAAGRGGIEFGREPTGFFIRVAPVKWADREVASERLIGAPVDYLASQAGVTAVYLLGRTENKLLQGEWRGETPFAALQSFAAAGGLQVEVPQPNVWVIGPPEFRASAAVTIAVGPAFAEEQSSLWGRDTPEVEEALIRALPVRDAGGYRGEVRIRVEYYWVAGEPPQTLLVVHHQEPSGGVNQRYVGGLYRAFKVRLRREEGKARLDCIWDSEPGGDEGAPEGRLIPEVAEDFDGDGIRDFYFQSRSDAPDVILSGADGHCLLRPFGIGVLAVEKSTRGPKRLALDGLWPEDVHGGAAGLGSDSVVAVRFDPGARRFALDAEATLRVARALGSGRHENGSLDPGTLLATEVGGKDKVRCYVLGGGSSRLPSGFEEVPAYDLVSRLRKGGAELAKLYTPRIVVDYKSTGFIEKERQRQERLREQRIP